MLGEIKIKGQNYKPLHNFDSSLQPLDKGNQLVEAEATITYEVDFFVLTMPLIIYLFIYLLNLTLCS